MIPALYLLFLINATVLFVWLFKFVFQLQLILYWFQVHNTVTRYLYTLQSHLPGKFTSSTHLTLYTVI